MSDDEQTTVLFDGRAELGARPSDVFSFVADHAGLPRWIPGLRRVDVDVSEAQTPGGVGTRRTLRMRVGPPGVEIVTAFEPPNRLAYSATDASLRRLCTNHQAELTCAPTPSGTHLRWTVRAKPSPSWWRRLAARFVFNAACGAGMTNLRKYFLARASDIPLSCRCGLVRGLAIDVSSRRGNRLVCYCDDCQAYARYLGREDIVDPLGGTDVYQTTPSQVEITTGVEHVRCVRLSQKGLVRWYAGCCRTPMGNTLASPRVPFVGVVHCFMDHASDGRARDEVLGVPRAGIQGRYAVGGVPPGAHRVAPLGIILRSLRSLVRAWLAGEHRPSAFFDSITGLPITRPDVLSGGERDELRP